MPLLVLLLWSFSASAGTIAVHDNQLYVDAVAQPQLFGAELQYFRLRGGSGRNVPRARVIELWNRALDRMVEAHMNAVSFYIPWDFHEYAEGKFDFTGSVDEDGDGLPDYPSRDLVTFFRLVREHGIHHILVRPGPYINAEWGFLGFGAVPEWFHRKFPDSHMRGPDGLRTKLYDYGNADFREYSRRWLSELHRQVLSRFIGPGQPVDFVQLDNETNYQWQSLYNHDYAAPALARYRAFLEQRYHTIAALDAAHGRSWESFSAVEAPKNPGVNLAEDQDWYRFHDVEIHDYLAFVRAAWEGIGVKEPSVLFTLAESYNAAAHGLLPNYELRNDPGVTGLMTVNLYPKTEETSAHPLFNQPFKADHDVKVTGAANARYFGTRQEWAMGPEIQAGWWRGIDVSDLARKQTYLSTVGHGLKALFLYYFNEGENWGFEWPRATVTPLYRLLHSEPRYASVPAPELPPSFWETLQASLDQQVMRGIDARDAILGTPADTLYFDAPLNGEAQATPHYELVKRVGAALAKHRAFLGAATEMNDPVCLLKDVREHAPSAVADSAAMNSDWSGGLVGYLAQAGVNPRVLHYGIADRSELTACRLLFVQDNGLASPGLAAFLRELVAAGATVVSLLDDSLARGAGFGLPRLPVREVSSTLHFDGVRDGFTAPTPLAAYSVVAPATRFLAAGNETVGYSWTLGRGRFVQLSALFYGVFNSETYASLTDVPARRAGLETLLSLAGVAPRVRITEGGDRVTAFGREHGGDFWVTVKSAREKDALSFHVSLSDAAPSKRYSITDLFSGRSIELTGQALAQAGIPLTLAPQESTALFVRALP